MPYTANPTDPLQPTIDVKASTAAAEFRALKSYIQGLVLTGVSAPIATVIYTAGAVEPAGYLKANGALVSRATYAPLFGIIGILYGAGDGSTTFALPDLRGEFIRSLDSGRGIDPARVLGSAQAEGFKNHTHGLNAAMQDDGGVAYNLAGGGRGSAVNLTSTSSLGGTETRPRNVALLACIKF